MRKHTMLIGKIYTYPIQEIQFQLVKITGKGWLPLDPAQLLVAQLQQNSLQPASLPPVPR